MNPSSDDFAFRALERALVRRRIRGLDLRLRIELSAIFVLLAAFAFWQLRVPLDGAAHHLGPLKTAGIALALLALFASAGAAVTAARMWSTLTRAAAGPEWLALPLNSAHLHRHLSWNARGPALLAALPACACLVALIGLVPIPWIVLLGGAFVGLEIETSRLAAALAFRAVAWRAKRRDPSRAGMFVPPIVHVLGLAPRDVASRRRPPASWKTQPAWRALLRMDSALTSARGRARARAIAAVLLALLSVVSWATPWSSPLLRVVAFAFSLLAAMAVAEWLIEVTCLHPFQALRSLPLGLASVWGSRATWGVLAAAALVLAQLSAARALASSALRVHLGWVGFAALLVGLLGANYAVTLYPRADQARRMLTLSLSLAVIASFMIPLMGWVLLLAAVLHSSRRLARFRGLDPA